MTQYPNDTIKPLPPDEQYVPQRDDSGLENNEGMPADPAEQPLKDGEEDAQDEDDLEDVEDGGDADAEEPPDIVPERSI